MTTDTRTTLNLPADLATELDEFWHVERFSSRNAAIRELLYLALKEWAKRHAKGSESRR